jgi:hypothetical protein
MTPEELTITKARLSRLAAAAGQLSSYAASIRTDRTSVRDDKAMASQTLDWCEGLIKHAVESSLALVENH